MYELKYKTRANSNPQNKPRVYFTCHPDDFDRFFNEITDDILKRQNCAVWYKKDMEQGFESEEEMELSLGQMQLFVIPVTVRLLTTPSQAMDVEFRFAMRMHIPVLPLLQEEELDQLFSQKFGAVQYLDPHECDITAISYDDKMNKYLDRILIGEELIEKVRAAFDAYIFMSYRKKDRKYAQELMKLIHNIPYCRDIAIWYDEYLTPGENFNDTIADALRKSDLFTLVVTPNLINEQNYILTTEYPMAIDEQKPILPVEMVSTDKNELKHKYHHIPHCLNGNGNEAFDDEFLAEVRKLAIESNDASMEHNFLVGLAYLDGIDVEVNFERAAALITTAAEQGLPEAMHKLYIIYRDGKGIEADAAAAKHWLEKCKESREAAYRQNPCQQTYDELCNTKDEFADLLWDESPEFNEELRRTLLHEYCSIGELAKEGSANGYKNVWMNEFRASYGKARIEYIEGKPGYGMSHFTHADSLLYHLKSKYPGKYDYEIGVLNYNRGMCYLKELGQVKDIPERRHIRDCAGSCFYSALNAFEDLEDRMPLQAKTYIYCLYEKLADLNFQKIRENETAGLCCRDYQEYFSKCITLCQEVIEEYALKRDQFNLAVFYKKEIKRQSFLENYTKADEYYQSAVSLFTELIARGYNLFRSKGCLADTHYEFSLTLRKQNQFQKSEEQLTTAMNMFQDLYNETKVKAALESYILTMKSMYFLKKQAGSMIEADKWLKAYTEKKEELQREKEKPGVTSTETQPIPSI